MDWQEFDKWIAAFCAWREDRGSDRNGNRDGIRAVLHVIANRAARHNKSWAQIVLQPLQFSSMTYPGDPQIRSGTVPVSPDPIFVDCYQIADSIANGTDPDLTNGATNYFADSIPMPEWAKSMTQTAQFGGQTFYK